MIRVTLPAHLRKLARVDGDVVLEVAGENSPAGARRLHADCFGEARQPAGINQWMVAVDETFGVKTGGRSGRPLWPSRCEGIINVEQAGLLVFGAVGLMSIFGASGNR